MNDQRPDGEPGVRRRHPARVAGLVLGGIAVAVALFFGQYALRRSISGDDGPVCVVTATSLERSAKWYDGGDHPLDPSDGDQYRTTSGCLVGEVFCYRTVELVGGRMYCTT